MSYYVEISREDGTLTATLDIEKKLGGGWVKMRIMSIKTVRHGMLYYDEVEKKHKRRTIKTLERYDPLKEYERYSWFSNLLTARKNKNGNYTIYKLFDAARSFESNVVKKE